MKLCCSVIFEELSNYFNVKTNKNFFMDEKIISPLIYNNEILHKDYIYIITVENIKNFIENGGHIGICLGTPTNLDMYKNLDLIIIDNTINIYDIFNKLVLIFAKYNQWESSINDITNKYLNIQEIFTSSESIFLEPIYLIDNDLNYIAYNKAYNNDKNLNSETTIPLSIANNIKLETDFNIISNEKDIFTYKSSSEDSITLCFNIKINDVI